jgi:hypothetical protein
MPVKLTGTQYTIVIERQPKVYLVKLYANSFDQIASLWLKSWYTPEQRNHPINDLAFTLRTRTYRHMTDLSLTDVQELIISSAQQWHIDTTTIAALVIDDQLGTSFTLAATAGEPLQPLQAYLQHDYTTLVAADTQQDDATMQLIRTALLDYLAEQLAGIPKLTTKTRTDTRLFADLIHGLNLLSPTELLNTVIMENSLADTPIVAAHQQWQPLYTLTAVETNSWQQKSR